MEVGAVIYGIAAALTVAAIAAYGWHRARRALLGVRAARRLDQAAMAREVAAVRREADRAGLDVEAWVLQEATRVIDGALRAAHWNEQEGGRDAA